MSLGCPYGGLVSVLLPVAERKRGGCTKWGLGQSMRSLQQRVGLLRGWRSESLDMGPLDTQVLWLQSEPLKAFLDYHSNKNKTMQSFQKQRGTIVFSTAVETRVSEVHCEFPERALLCTRYPDTPSPLLIVSL